MENIKTVLGKFDFKGDLVSCKEFGSGHINKTYIAKYDENGTEQCYVVQRVNGNVFKNIDELMENVFAVTSYLREVIKQNGGDPDRETLHYIKTKDGAKYYRGDGNSCYRAYVFVKDSISYDYADTEELFGASGIAFGKFQRMLGGFDSGKLYVTIPNFHNTIWRYENEFLPALQLDVKNRAKNCEAEIEFINSRKNEMGKLEALAASGEIPLRVTHNDTKLNNVMFDKNTNECVCVIDLDTVMPGIALFDFADAIRFGASTAAEDEADLSKVSLNLDYFEAYAKGFLSEAGDTLNECEKANLAFASKLITLELGMRFLTDYLSGDVYFKTDYKEHNLVRAKNQLALAKDMESKMSEMNSIILNCRQ
ncbi:MAG: aminoglycoside phosphotransferase family protein [Eubacterium sp.]|nr:aminoglycoside phosphotransferase family protein [Eubacterium sp.]MBR1531814.1 aminoglycoside phosphotransferase family protein [Eubacterium sp.]MBR2278088.1 aminoglycoside phosphotransferase family protein [Eubacterium sp.]